MWYPTVQVDHSAESIEYNRYFADFLVHESRGNQNKFSSYEEEVKAQTESFGELVMLPSYTGLIYAF